MKPKVWLKQNGHIDSIGRGRISAENKARIAAAVAADPTLVIEGYSTGTGASVAKPTAATIKPAESAGVGVEYREPRRDKNEWDAFYLADGKKQNLGMATPCENCGSSLTYCNCRVPVARDCSRPHAPLVMVDFAMKSI